MGECVWQGLVEDGQFTSGAGWEVWTHSQSDTARSAIANGELELSVGQRCSSAWAGTVARLPPASALPSGVALVFNYAGRIDVDDEGATIRFTLRGLEDGDGLLLDGERRKMRRCMRLGDPWLAQLEFSLAANGFCEEAVEYGLRVDDIRLEPDASCSE